MLNPQKIPYKTPISPLNEALNHQIDVSRGGVDLSYIEVEPGLRINKELINYTVSPVKEDPDLIACHDDIDPDELLAVQLVMIYLTLVLVFAGIKSFVDWLNGVVARNPNILLFGGELWIYLTGIAACLFGIIWGVRRLYMKYKPLSFNRKRLLKNENNTNYV